jgi:hypothetical protein
MRRLMCLPGKKEKELAEMSLKLRLGENTKTTLEAAQVLSGRPEPAHVVYRLRVSE